MKTPSNIPGQGLVPGNRVRVAPEPARVSPPGHQSHEPQVVLIRDGDTVRAIEVRCTCGKTIRMNCTF